MAITINTATSMVVDADIKGYKKQIESLRASLNSPSIKRSPEMTQKVYDQIEELKRKIEKATRSTRRAVPIKNAPVVGQRQVTKRKRHFTI